jgi:hypothetical protein
MRISRAEAKPAIVTQTAVCEASRFSVSIGQFGENSFETRYGKASWTRPARSVGPLGCLSESSQSEIFLA